MKKNCKECGKRLDVSYFSPCKNLKDGYENKCRKCRLAKRNMNHKCVCQYCHKEFTNAKKDKPYCSAKCAGLARRNRVKKNCDFCGKEIEVTKYKTYIQKLFYCNHNCRTEHLKELMCGKENPNYERIEYFCDGCGKEIMLVPYKLKTQKHVFCSNECFKKNIGKFYAGKNNHNYRKEKAICNACGKVFERIPSELKKYENVYCSRKCFESVGLKQIFLNNIVEKIEIPCAYCGKKIELLESQTKDKQNIYCSKECKNQGYGKLHSGENSPRWNPDLTEEERRERRKTPEYTDWRNTVYERDNYTCQCCGDNTGGNLNAHHLESHNINKELRIDINNGITLCVDCHKEFHSIYGYGNNNKFQFYEFIKIKKSDLVSKKQLEMF